MLKKYLIALMFSITLCSCLRDTQAVYFSLDWLGTITAQSTGYKNMVEIQSKLYSKGPLSHEDEAEIRSILKELGGQTVELYAMSKVALDSLGHTNAFALGNGIYVNSDFFHTLPIEEKRFLLAHELAHIQQSHLPQRFGVASVLGQSAAISALLQAWLCYYLYSKTTNSQTKAALVSGTLVTTIGTLVAGRLLSLAYTRSQEFDADKQAALKVGVQPGLDFFNTMEVHYNTYDFKPLFNRLIVGHPSYQARKEALVKLNK